ncbi:hypothetical protein GCM10011591_40400 [Nocardia camponoti]|uniref:Uncharacterized protein n=1 Tax=Nocardia camponoti TaxID=1616106 RepID=A0A917VCG2_9NOCA|nr:hypothetical protein GCM10011591_40400 [Nocardia camponoti]
MASEDREVAVPAAEKAIAVDLNHRNTGERAAHPKKRVGPMSVDVRADWAHTRRRV